MPGTLLTSAGHSHLHLGPSPQLLQGSISLIPLPGMCSFLCSFLYSTLTREVPRTFEFAGRSAKDTFGQSLSPAPGVSCRERHMLIRTDAEGQKTQGQGPTAAFAVEVPFQVMW